jgi:hypothetical protein
MRRHLTYANVMASIALFVALGGASYAAVKIPSNSVGSQQLKKNAVINSKIKARSIRGSKVGVDTILGINVKESSLTTVPRAKLADTATKAASATTATSAVTATSARTATTATSAANADKVGGLSATDLKQKCPATGTVIAFGMCVELKDHATTQTSLPLARQACSDAGGRIPTAYELDAVRNWLQTTGFVWGGGNGGSQREWTSDIGPINATPSFVSMDQTGGTEVDVPATLNYYRCAIYPSNR